MREWKDNWYLGSNEKWHYWKGPVMPWASASWARFQRNKLWDSGFSWEEWPWWYEKTGSTRSDQYYLNARSSLWSWKRCCTRHAQQRRSLGLAPEPREESYIIGGSQILKLFSDQLGRIDPPWFMQRLMWDTFGNTKIWREPWKSPSPSSERWEEPIWFYGQLL